MALKRMGFEGRLASHGMRSMASTILNEQGWDPELIEVALAHVDKDEVRSAYNRADYIERRRPMMALVERACSGGSYWKPVGISYQGKSGQKSRLDTLIKWATIIALITCGHNA